MERIKQAIETAVKEGAGPNGHPDMAHSHNSKHQGTAHAPHGSRLEKAKMIIAGILIILAGWLWLKLDFMNQLELMASEYIHEGIERARMEVKSRLANEARFKQLMVENRRLINDNYIHCQVAAEKGRDNYLLFMKEALRKKNENLPAGNHDKFILPVSVINETAVIMKSAKAECLRIHDEQISRN